MLTHIGTQTIETERLTLREFEFTDGTSMLRNWIADEKIQSLYSEPTDETEEAVKERLTKCITSYEKEDYYRWAVINNISSFLFCPFFYCSTLIYKYKKCASYFYNLHTLFYNLDVFQKDVISL